MEFQFCMLIDLKFKETNEAALTLTPRNAYSYSIDDYYFLTVTCDFAHLLNLPLHTKSMTQF